MVGKWCRPVHSVSMWWGWYQVNVGLNMWCTGYTQQHTRYTRITHHTYIMPDTHTRLVGTFRHVRYYILLEGTIALINNAQLSWIAFCVFPQLHLETFDIKSDHRIYLFI